MQTISYLEQKNNRFLLTATKKRLFSYYFYFLHNVCFKNDNKFNNIFASSIIFYFCYTKLAPVTNLPKNKKF